MSEKKTICVIFGTRPEAVKLVPVILALKQKASFSVKICVTAQHRQMLDQVLDLFSIIPDVDLNLMLPDQTLGRLTSNAIQQLDHYLARERPDAVLVQGDTTTVFCGALASFYNHIPVGHVEAGLRTGNLYAPWPEEANRVLTTRLARWHFAPTATNRANLLREGVAENDVFVTGNTVIDALFLALDRLKTHSVSVPGLPDNTLGGLGDSRMVLITGHRRENFGLGFENICCAIAELARIFTDTHFVYPVHMNPNVREPVQRILNANKFPNIHLLEPQPYLAFVALMNRAALILTDSGGVQEEAPSLGKPVLVMRDTTERPEAVSAGTVKLVGTETDSIVSAVSRLLLNPSEYEAMSKKANPYGDGHAAERIVAFLEHKLCEF